jgi:hypothetical protein
VLHRGRRVLCTSTAARGGGTSFSAVRKSLRRPHSTRSAPPYLDGPARGSLQLPEQLAHRLGGGALFERLACYGLGFASGE